MVERNSGLPPERRIEFRVGMHFGDIVEDADCDLISEGATWPRASQSRRGTPAVGRPI
jgi:hypothetical protein